MKEFNEKFEQLRNLKPTKEKLERNNFLYDHASNIYNSLLAHYEQQYSNFLAGKKKSKPSKHSFSDLFLNDYEYGYNVEVQKLDQFSPLEGDIS